MPEGAEVKTIVDQIKKIENSKIIKLDLIGGRFKTKPDISLLKFQEELNDCQYPIIEKINCKGKFIYWNLSGQSSIISTLGMSGAWQFQPSKHSGLKFDLLINHQGIEIREVIYFNDVRHFGTVKRVSEKVFYDFISNYNTTCNDCLLVYRSGWPFYGEISQFSTKKTICDSGNHKISNNYRNEYYANCINITEI